MSLANRRSGAPHALRIPGAPATLPSRHLSTKSTAPQLCTYGLQLSSLHIEPSDPPAIKKKNSKKPVENHEKQHPPILVGRDPRWAHFHFNGSSALWAVHLLDHIEQTFPLQPIIALTPHCKIIRGWEAHIGAFDISHPSRLEGKPWLFPRAALTWWSESYTEQLKRLFPREDIVFLLHRAEEVIASLKAGDDEFRNLKESLYWLMAESTPSICSSVASTHTFSLSTSVTSNPSTIADKYTRSVLQSYSVRITALRTMFSAIHRLPALLVVIRSLLQYLRVRARSECAAIAARERKRTNTVFDGQVIERLGEMACWHVAPEERLEELEGLAVEWFECGERWMRDLGRLADLIDCRLGTD
ncbi:hypothetical protein CcaverHIS631_0601470 [Cutaneotrichosporon cavernicola]|nr:hypothetical protein CcaverHIS631_0601470 [Cutaneotrichosporon cavernicola]BEJ09231.1 hypothetical protein CcaverHIS641_0601460 [Cutaneotrichosporon cavernicola]